MRREGRRGSVSILRDAACHTTCTQTSTPYVQVVCSKTLGPDERACGVRHENGDSDCHGSEDEYGDKTKGR